MSAAAAEETDANALAHRPAFDALADHIDPSDSLVAGHSRPIYRQTPSTVAESEWHTPQASTRIRTSPGPGSRMGFRTSSSRPGATACTARYIDALSIISFLRPRSQSSRRRAWTETKRKRETPRCRGSGRFLSGVQSRSATARRVFARLRSPARRFQLPAGSKF
jgi:hypothetical protein